MSERRRAGGMGILIVSHLLAERERSDRVYELREGRASLSVIAVAFTREHLRAPLTLALLIAIPAIFVWASASVLGDFARALGGALAGDAASALARAGRRRSSPARWGSSRPPRRTPPTVVSRSPASARPGSRVHGSARRSRSP